MVRIVFVFLLTAILPAVTGLAAAAGDAEMVVSDSAAALLTDARCAEVRATNASEISCFMSFSGTVPNFFYEADSGSNQVIVRLLDTRMGGMTQPGRVDTVNLGPVVTLTVREEIQDKNATVKLMTPEWYYVTIVTISCKPMIRRQNDLVVAQIENAISLTFPWPEKMSERNKYYILSEKRRRPALVLSIIGVAVAGLAGGGYCAYHYYYLPSRDAASRPLEPVLPEHPSP